MQPDQTSHAPHSKASPLFLLGITSLLLGALFLVWRVLVDTDTPDLLTEGEQRRNLLLLVVGVVLSSLGILTVLLHIASDPNLSAGVRGKLGERLERGNLLTRVALLPALLVSQKRGRQILNILLMVVLATWLFGLTNYLFNRHDLWRIDMTSAELYTLSEESKALVQGLDTRGRQLRIVGVMPPGLRSAAQIQSLLDQYSAASDLLETEYFDPTAITRDKREAKLQELDIAGAAGVDGGGLVVQSGNRDPDGVWVKEKSKWISERELWSQDVSRGVQAAKRVFAGEQRISSAILEVLEETKPKLYFLTGHGEVSIGDFKPEGLAHLVQRLRERNYEVATLDLLKAKQPGVPKDCSLLVVVGPKRDMTPDEVRQVREYLEAGGDALFLLEANTTVRREGRKRVVAWHDSALATMLTDTFGVGLGDRWVGRVAARQGRGMRIAYDLPLITLDKTHPATQALAERSRPVFFVTARPVVKQATLNVNTYPLVKTDPNWGNGCFAVGQPYMATMKELDREPGPHVLAMAVNREEPATKDEKAKRTRFVVFGDAEWASNRIVLQRSFANLELFLNSLNWCIERETRTAGQIRRPGNYKLEMSEQELATFKLASILGFPLLAIALGIFAWVVRFRS